MIWHASRFYDFATFFHLSRGLSGCYVFNQLHAAWLSEVIGRFRDRERKPSRGLSELRRSRLCATSLREMSPQLFDRRMQPLQTSSNPITRASHALFHRYRTLSPLASVLQPLLLQGIPHSVGRPLSPHRIEATVRARGVSRRE